MADKSNVFPLDFNAQEWTVEEALPWLFFGDERNADVWKDKTKFAVRFVVGDVDERSNNIYLKPYIRALQRYISEHREVRSHTAFSPLVWCRLAIQFWLTCGNRQDVFMSAMTKWIRQKNKGGTAHVVYLDRNSGKYKKMPMEVFLFSGGRLPSLLETEWEYKQASTSQPPPRKPKAQVGKRSYMDQVGANLLSAVKQAVTKVVGNKSGESAFLRRADKETGKHRYRGTKYNLLTEICPAGKDSGGKWKLANGKGISLYAESTLIKAISKVAICRKSWL